MDKGVYGGKWPVNKVGDDDNKELEEWRKVFNRKMGTKAFIRGDIGAYFDDLPMYDDPELTLTRVVEELIWHWIGRLQDSGWCGYDDIPKDHKRQYKVVCNNFLKKYADKELVPDYCLNWGHVKIEDGKVLLK